MRQIPNEEALPCPVLHKSARSLTYIRCKTDPTVLVAGDSGECFQRRDGAKWEHPAYRMTLDRDDVTVTCTTHSAYCDTATYEPATKKGRAA